ncbi:metallophosphoesterase [Leptolyngbya sp. FACHB-261]|uniref:metallophosphoesterase n=1 Tax=Leptolyngbya sp. FACHB-261 TaxID=2692806 RepID=UPI001686D915|nr:metallophosphoesterase [Leptolyngbya sp. FACHB-261]MBD2099350.1 metallophosphoesterase [Leptolyngbya sp. FACHB-261]
MHRLLAGPLSVETLTIPIAGLPSALKDTKLVQLSDFHFDGLRLSEDLLQQAIETTNEAEPDLILLTGDYITTDPTPAYSLAHRLKALQSRAGVYAVLGNHDLCWPNAKATVTEALESVDIQVLWNQVVYPLGTGLALVGLPDFRAAQFEPASVMAQIEPETPRIVLSHNPDSAEVLQQWRVDLQLSGHTHGGQIVLPGLGPMHRWVERLNPFSYKVVHHWEWSEGLHQVGNNRLYVNRGLGTYLPGRFLCPPEVTIINLI